ncbi:hypothetical protein [Knoellia subterranea]|nr:hypothetical protein [Knoellia subterranea]
MCRTRSPGRRRRRVPRRRCRWRRSSAGSGDARRTASQLIGIAMFRHVLGIEPHASLPRERIVAIVGPTVQHYLTGDLGG